MKLSKPAAAARFLLALNALSLPLEAYEALLPPVKDNRFHDAYLVLEEFYSVGIIDDEDYHALLFLFSRSPN